MNSQISFLGKKFCTEEEIAELERQAEIFADYAKKKRRWENSFQKWSDENAVEGGTEDYGVCGYGSICDWCEDNSYGRPCVRALNAMCREKGIRIDYSDIDFEKVWRRL